MLSNRPGETFDPVTATRTGWKACRGFRPSASAAARNDASIAAASNGSREASVSSVAEKEAREAGELGQPRDLLLHERCRLRDELGIPRVAVLAEPDDEPVRELVRRQLAEVDPVHPVELRVVELRRAGADALERETLDQLVAGHDGRLAVGCPAEQREEVHERLGEVSVLAELVDRDSAVA